MSAGADHYQRLGVSRSASVTEIRAAYRAAARRRHPDTAGPAGAADMAALNEAWRVLSDPGRRALYDLSLRDPVDAPRAVPEPAVWLEPHAPATARRFPVWPFVALFVLAVIFIMTAGGLSDDPQPLGPDNVITAGSCVSLEPSGDAVEVACDGLHDAVAVALVGFDQTCPSGSAAHRDRQGRGWVCVEPG